MTCISEKYFCTISFKINCLNIKKNKRSFRIFLKDKQEKIYGVYVKKCTQNFVTISKGVRAVESRLREHFKREDLANLLRSVQLHEKEKLTLVRANQTNRSWNSKFITKKRQQRYRF